MAIHLMRFHPNVGLPIYLIKTDPNFVWEGKLEDVQQVVDHLKRKVLHLNACCAPLVPPRGTALVGPDEI